MLFAFLAVAVLAAAIATPSHAKKPPREYGDHAAVVEAVTDGDTLKVTIPGWPPIVGDHIGVRVRDVDTQELKSKDQTAKDMAEAAKALVMKRLKPGDKVMLRRMGRGKYFRIVAEVILADGTSWADIVSGAALARPYDGQGPKPWKK